MKLPYKSPTFLEGVGVALALSLGTVCLQKLAHFLGLPAASLSELVIGLGAAYTFYLLARSRRRSGRVTALSGWIIVTAIAWIIDPSPTATCLVQITTVALIRMFLYQPRPVTALSDAGLWVLGAGAATWTALSTASLGLTVWCFFLIQSLFPLVSNLAPTRMRHSRWFGTTKGSPSGTGGTRENAGTERFERAHGSAENALRRAANRATTP